MKVLILDDSLTVRMDLCEAFTDAGYDSIPCACLEEARDAVRMQRPSLIISDVVLPDGDGVSFLGELQQQVETAAIPVILLSSEDEVRDRIRGLRNGAREYIGKPYETNYVIARARALLRSTIVESEIPLILLVDDSPTYRFELAEQLESEGYRVMHTASAGEGLRRTADMRPHGIIVDGVMPEMSGAEFIRKLRLDPGLRSTPCLLLTASEEPESEVVALDSGADAYARKGEGFDLVLARLMAMLRSVDSKEDRPPQSSLMGPKRILAVDDSATYLESIASELRVNEYEVVRARSGREALSLLDVEKVDAILLDLHMPEMSGLETCRIIKASPNLRGIPVIILTAEEGRGALIDGMNAGADDYVGKSSNFEVIKARLMAQLRRKQFEDENRGIRDDLLRREAETRVAREVGAVRQELLDQLSEKNRELSHHVNELSRLNKELETFAYSVSHDLRQPLRSIHGFSKILLESCEMSLDEQGKHYLKRVVTGAERMGKLIDGLLSLSRVTRAPLTRKKVHLGQLARSIVESRKDSEPDRDISATIDNNAVTEADPNLVESVLVNLLGNAWKFTSQTANAHVEFGIDPRDPDVYYVRDNGVGFDMEYVDKLFGPFQRLHSPEQFEGTGIGLATVQRIIQRHGGRIWAESAVNHGTTFFFTLKERSETA